jgi:hypothetical protein
MPISMYIHDLNYNADILSNPYSFEPERWYDVDRDRNNIWRNTFFRSVGARELVWEELSYGGAGDGDW